MIKNQLIKNLLYKLTDIICFIGGPILFVYNAFEYIIPLWTTRHIYDPEMTHNKLIIYRKIFAEIEPAKIWMLIGLSLFILGFLIRSWQQQISK